MFQEIQKILDGFEAGNYGEAILNFKLGVILARRGLSPWAVIPIY